MMERSVLLKELNEEFKKKDISSIREKRLIFVEVLGYPYKMCAIREPEIVKVINFLKTPEESPLKKEVAWAYMVELDDGLTKKQVARLLALAPTGTSLFPFTLNDNPGLLESNSIALGFVDNEHYDDLEEIQKTLADVCNDWSMEKEDEIYTTSSGLHIKMISDFQSIIIPKEVS